MTAFLRHGDLIHKKISSIVFRIIIVIYSIFLIRIHDNYFHDYLYYFYIALYFIMYIFLFDKRRPLLRTLNDYVLIFVVLYMKDVSIVYNFIFILFPLINAPNHTGTKRCVAQLYFFTILIFIILSFVSSLSYELIYILIGITFLSIISYFELSRAKMFDSVFSIYKKIDDMTSKNRNRTQIPEIYRIIIEKLSDRINIKQITCFREEKKSFILKNSSKFVYKYEFDFNKVTYDVSAGKLPININDKELYSVVTVKIRQLIFMIITEKEASSLSISKRLYLMSIAPLLFEKIAKIMEFENNLGKEEYRRIKELSKKQHFVLEVMKSTHFLSNKLSPIKNYLTAREQLDSSTKLNQKQREQIQVYENAERKKASISLKSISDKINLLLNKESNPFIPTSMKKVKARYIFMLIKRLWIQENDEKDITVENVTDENLNKKIITNEDALEYIFTDIFTNISKYSNGYKNINFNFEDGIVIQIKNNIVDYRNKESDLLKIVNNYNNDDRLEINKRNNFGLLHIKELSQQLSMDVSLKLDNQNKLFITEIEFKGDLI